VQGGGEGNRAGAARVAVLDGLHAGGMVPLEDGGLGLQVAEGAWEGVGSGSSSSSGGGRSSSGRSSQGTGQLQGAAVEGAARVLVISGGGAVLLDEVHACPAGGGGRTIR